MWSEVQIVQEMKSQLQAMQFSVPDTVDLGRFIRGYKEEVLGKHEGGGDLSVFAVEYLLSDAINLLLGVTSGGEPSTPSCLITTPEELRNRESRLKASLYSKWLERSTEDGLEAPSSAQCQIAQNVIDECVSACCPTSDQMDHLEPGGIFANWDLKAKEHVEALLVLDIEWQNEQINELKRQRVNMDNEVLSATAAEQMSHPIMRVRTRASSMPETSRTGQQKNANQNAPMAPKKSSGRRLSMPSRDPRIRVLQDGSNPEGDITAGGDSEITLNHQKMQKRLPSDSVHKEHDPAQLATNENSEIDMMETDSDIAAVFDSSAGSEGERMVTMGSPGSSDRTIGAVVRDCTSFFHPERDEVPVSEGDLDMSLGSDVEPSREITVQSDSELDESQMLKKKEYLVHLINDAHVNKRDGGKGVQEVDSEGISFLEVNGGSDGGISGMSPTPEEGSDEEEQSRSVLHAIRVGDDSKWNIYCGTSKCIWNRLCWRPVLDDDCERHDSIGIDTIRAMTHFFRDNL